MRERCMGIGVALLLAGCTSDPPPGDTVAQAPEAAPATIGDRPVYQKPEGVIIDTPRLIGRELASLPGSELDNQLGRLVQEQRLPGVRGIERVYQNGTLRVAKGTIYYISHTYDVPVNRVLALQLLGLPGNLSPLVARSLQFRIDRPTHAIRRIALQRAEMNSEMVSQVEVWSALPTEEF